MLLSIRMLVLLLALFTGRHVFALRCMCSTEKGAVNCYNQWCDVNDTGGKVGACAVVQVGYKRHYACVRVKRSSEDSCKVDRKNGLQQIRCWCRSSDYCNVDLAERVDEETSLIHKTALEIPTTTTVSVDRFDTDFIIEQNYDIIEQKEDQLSRDFWSSEEDEDDYDTHFMPSRTTTTPSAKNEPGAPATRTETQERHPASRQDTQVRHPTQNADRSRPHDSRDTLPSAPLVYPAPATTRGALDVPSLSRTPSITASFRPSTAFDDEDNVDFDFEDGNEVYGQPQSLPRPSAGEPTIPPWRRQPPSPLRPAISSYAPGRQDHYPVRLAPVRPLQPVRSTTTSTTTTTTTSRPTTTTTTRPVPKTTPPPPWKLASGQKPRDDGYDPSKRYEALTPPPPPWEWDREPEGEPDEALSSQERSEFDWGFLQGDPKKTKEEREKETLSEKYEKEKKRLDQIRERARERERAKMRIGSEARYRPLDLIPAVRRTTTPKPTTTTSTSTSTTTSTTSTTTSEATTTSTPSTSTSTTTTTTTSTTTEPLITTSTVETTTRRRRIKTSTVIYEYYSDEDEQTDVIDSSLDKQEETLSPRREDKTDEYRKAIAGVGLRKASGNTTGIFLFIFQFIICILRCI